MLILFTIFGQEVGALSAFLTSVLVPFFTLLGGWLARREIEKRRQLKELQDKIIEIRTIENIFSSWLNIPPDQLTVDAVRVLLSSQRNAMDMMRKFIQTSPGPYLIWCKRRNAPYDYVMAQVNDYFAKIFIGQDASFYNGKPDAAVFPKEMADAFAKNDEKAYISGRLVVEREFARSHLTGWSGEVISTKWSFGNYVCGIGRVINEEYTGKDLEHD